MLKEITFFDKSHKFTDEIAKLFVNVKHLQISRYEGDVRNLRDKNLCYFSPANSFLFFDGGIDAVYYNMFPEIQTRAQKQLSQLNKKTSLGRNYLPIGSAMMVRVDKKNKNYIVACPTMFRPQDIRGTRNVYWAFYAGLSLVNRYNGKVREGDRIRILAVPGLGTGYGKMTWKESAEQIYEAYQDYYEKKKRPLDNKFVEYYKIYLDEPNREEKPNY